MRSAIIGLVNALMLVISGTTCGQETAKTTGYPDRPVRVIVPVAPGGSTDFIARVISAKLGEALGPTFVVDNRSGAGSLIGTDIVAKAQPDGYTLLSTYAAHTIAPLIYSKVPYDVEKDFAPITVVGAQPLIITLHPSVKANTVQELISLAKSKTGNLNVALMTPSSSGALAAELFKILTNTPQMVSVPFKGGGPAMIALLSGEVQLVFATPPDVLAHLKSGKVKAIGTTSKNRLPYLPDVPTLVEQGVKDLNTAPWYGLLAPARTPAAIIDKLYKQITEILKTPDVRERLAASGTDVVGNSPKEFAEQIRRELEQNGKVIKAVGMKAD
jgi:tripartite-type tricarboxylate transporter receptor subunit TctC